MLWAVLAPAPADPVLAEPPKQSGPKQSGNTQPRPEHPRPDFRRDDWLNLNGTWKFRFDPHDRGRSEGWQNATDGSSFDREITVPFCWESPLSGIAQWAGRNTIPKSGISPKGATAKKIARKNIGWYRRCVTVPEGFRGKRVWLRFGAVDSEAQVWANGRRLGSHPGGYTPFEFDVTALAAPGEELCITVRVFDPTGPEQPLGKQVPGWYTPTSGIWQTVWLEARPALHIRGLSMVPRHKAGLWTLDVGIEIANSAKTGSETSPVDREVRIELVSPRAEFSKRVVLQKPSGENGRIWTTLEIPLPKTWSPRQPHLYDLDIRLGGDIDGSDGDDSDDGAGGPPADTVHTYFALRTIERKKFAGSDFEMFLLNGRPVYLRGALDQSFNPQGICTAPSDQFMRRDMEIARSLGINLLRIHIKSEEPRRLYWADRMGVMLMADMPCTFKHTPRAKAAWESTMRDTIRRDRNHPSIIAWCLFNESWGLGGKGFKKDRQTQEWVLRMWSLVKNKLDPSRLVEDNSPCLGDHVKTDINSWHFYTDDHARARRIIGRMVRGTYPGSPANYVPGKVQAGEPLFVSEYGAVGAHGGDRDISWGFRDLTTQLRRHAIIQGYVYTELTDVEWEHNGLANYDRTPKEFGYDAFVPGMRVADLQGEDFVGFDAPAVFEVSPGDVFTIPIFVSHFSQRRCEPRLRWRIVGIDNLGQTVETAPKERPVVWRQYDVTFQKPVTVTVPTDRPFVGALALELLDGGRGRLGANYINLVVRPISTKVLPNGQAVTVSRSLRVEVLGPRRVALRFSPDDFSSFGSRYPAGHWLDRRGKFIGFGSCEVKYRIAIPGFVRAAIPSKLVLMTELSTKSDGQRLDWPEVRRPLDCPQTEERKHPGRVAVRLFDTLLWNLDLPDDPADSRGVLSHQNRLEHGSYGYLARKKIDLTHRHGLREKLRNEPRFTLTFRAVGKPAARGTENKKGGAGISLFGERTGRYPIDPTIIIETARDLKRSADSNSTEPVAVDRLLDKAKAVDMIKTSERGGHEWRFTTSRPGPRWTSAKLAAGDDSKWLAGKSSFGRMVDSRIPHATFWKTPDIWLRTKAQLPDHPLQITLRYFHDGDTEIYVNGKQLIKLTGRTPGYRDLPLTKEQMALFHEGPNTIAVHSRGRKGLQAVDVGLRCIVIER